MRHDLTHKYGNTGETFKIQPGSYAINNSWLWVENKYIFQQNKK